MTRWGLLFSRPVFAMLILLNIWIFFVVSQGSLVEKLNTPLRILTFYSLAIGLMSKTKVMRTFTDDMTDPNFYKFQRGNLTFLMFLTSLSALWISPSKVVTDSRNLAREIAMDLFSFPVGVFATLVFWAYIVAHLTVIMPLSYIAYTVASVPVRGIQSSADDTILGVTERGEHHEESIKSTVLVNLAAFRSFFVAILSTSFQAIITLAPSLVSGLQDVLGLFLGLFF